jgi:hypothetical protein
MDPNNSNPQNSPPESNNPETPRPESQPGTSPPGPEAQTPERSKEKQGNEFHADLSHISGANVNLAGNNVINIQVNSDKQAREVLRELREEAAAHHIPPPPAPDAPLQERIDHWFDNELKTDQEKFFAITLSMFNGLKYPDFKDIYEIVLHVMEVEEEKEKDKDKPRSRFVKGDGDLMGKIKAEITRSNDGLEEIIKFENERYPVAIFTLMRRRYRDVLLDLLPALKQVVEKHRYWLIRVGASLAVAEIGKLGFHRMRDQVLEPWAGNQRAYVRAAVGYPLARLAEDETFRKGVEDLLDDWIDPDWSGPGETWRYRWTAASVYKQIGSIEAEWAREWAYRGLAQVAGYDDIRLADSVIHSLTVLSLQGQLKEILLLLKGWIEQGSAGSDKEDEPQLRCLVGMLAFMVLSEVHIELATEEKEEVQELGLHIENLFELICQGEANQTAVWRLVTAIGIRAFEYHLANAFFNLIARWTEHSGENPEVQNSVRNLLAAVYMQVRPRPRQHILNRLALWEKHKTKECLAEMARSARVKIEVEMSRGPQPAAPTQKHIVFGD